MGGDGFALNKRKGEMNMITGVIKRRFVRDFSVSLDGTQFTVRRGAIIVILGIENENYWGNIILYGYDKYHGNKEGWYIRPGTCYIPTSHTDAFLSAVERHECTIGITDSYGNDLEPGIRATTGTFKLEETPVETGAKRGEGWFLELLLKIFGKSKDN
jgi:hypothetical protein